MMLRAVGQGLGVLLVTAVLLALLELGASFVVGPVTTPALAPEIPGDAVSRTVTYIEVNPAPLVRDAELLWRNEPLAKKTQPINPAPFGHDDTWTIENDSHGFRGPEVGTVDAAATYRILCVGDSITFGFNVDQDDTYPHQLQALLASRHPGRQIEVVNGGVPGWSWLQGLRFLETRGLALAPDAVLIGHGTNDQLLPARVTDEERFHRLGGPISRAVRSVGVGLILTNLYRAVERVFPPPPFAPDRDSPACQRQIQRVGRCSRVSVDEIASAVHEVHRLTAAAGSDLVVMNLDFTETLAVTGIRNGVNRDRLTFIDAVDALRTRRRARETERSTRLGLAAAVLPEAPPSTDGARAKQVVLRVLTPDRTASYGVKATGYYQPGFEGAAPVVDDGTNGDERAGDGVYSTTLTVPANITAIVYRFHRGPDDEFRTLPPLSSTMADRLLRVPADAIGPVDVFADAIFMAERAHPNAEGQRIVAELAAERVEALPSFQRFVGASQ